MGPYELQEYQKRVVAERDALMNKTDALRAFIYQRGQVFESLNQHEQFRMVTQLTFMQGYLQTLEERIANFVIA